MHQQQPNDPWSHFRDVVAQADYVLTSEVYEVLWSIVLASSANAQIGETLRQDAPEYGRAEFLLCVDRTGEPVSLPDEVVADFRYTAKHNPEFQTWLQPVKLPDGSPVLLIARWLCHWAGFRHRAIHLLIDHPASSDYVLVQVRGLGKAEAPGCFDLPAAGHIVGLESVTDTLFKELQEELGLSRGDLDAVKSIGAYEYRDMASSANFYNVEYRMVYHARLKPEAAVAIHFADGEVAALAAFSLPELQALMRQFPDRVASGLAMSLPFYLEQQMSLWREGVDHND